MYYVSFMILEIPYSDPRFPESIKNLKNPPQIIHVLIDDLAGTNFSWPARSLAVIGSRNISDYGRKIVLDFIPRLVDAGIAIVSGLAEGIDEEAQKAALKCGGVTIGVLGFGVMKLDDFSNRELGKHIIKSRKGLLVSFLEPYTPATKYTFLERNRLIAALSKGVLVIEATHKSGCVSTVEAALELGKDVYAVPGDIFNYTSMGTNELIKQGANLANSAVDIIESGI